jgi:hypothetical protein
MSARAQELSRQREPAQRELSGDSSHEVSASSGPGEKTAFLSQPGLNTKF